MPYCILYNKRDDKCDGIPSIMSYRIDKVLNTGLANKCIESAIINYTYSPSNSVANLALLELNSALFTMS